MTIQKFMRCFPDIPIRSETVTAADYLESRGKYFMLDFGYLDAEAKARYEFENDTPLCGLTQ